MQLWSLLYTKSTYQIIAVYEMIRSVYPRLWLVSFRCHVMFFAFLKLLFSWSFNEKLQSEMDKSK